MKFCLFRRVCQAGLFLLLLLFARFVQAVPDLRFDIIWFCCPCFPTNHICEAQFDHLNITSTNGHYIGMPTDDHRADVNASGNVLAMYYNTFDDGAWVTNTGLQAAALIDQWANSNFTNTGPKPEWLILNEIASGPWPSTSSYRAYVTSAVHALATTYGYKVIIYAPFANPGNNASDWQSLAADAYIAIENYLSGLEIKNQGFSVSWCQSQYQSSVTSYVGLGVAKSRLMLGEHFGQTTNSAWGRDNVSSNDWVNAISARSVAARNVGFPGFLSFAWYSDLMLTSDSEMIVDEDAYASNSLPSSNPLTPPYIISQPQNQNIPPGGVASFNVVTAGIAPLTYQWRKDGTNLPGATANPLVISNISGVNDGVYNVVIHNNAGTTNSASAVLLDQAPPPLAFDPFAPAMTTYTVGANLIGQTNASNLFWTAAGPAGVNPVIAAGNLTVSGLAPVNGNSISFGVSTGPSARFNFPNSISAGTIYYSFAFRVDSLGSLSTNGGFFAAFNNSTGTQTTVPSAVAACVQTRSSGAGFNVGLKGAVGGSVFDTNVYAVGQTVFVVGSYTLNPNTGDDTASMWINPDRSTFGAANIPVPTLTAASGGDISGNAIASFIFFRRGSGNTGLEPSGITADELRISTNWASVTPPMAITVIPTLSATLAGNNVVLAWTTNAVGFNLYSTPALLQISNAWSVVTNAVTVAGTNCLVTNNISGGGRFYRLSNP